MQGKVTLINRSKGLAALFTEQGRFVLLHFPRSVPLALHDVLQGAMGVTGHTFLVRETNRRKVPVHVHCCDCSLMAAKEALGMLEPVVTPGGISPFTRPAQTNQLSI